MVVLQKNAFRQNPEQPSVRRLKTITTASGRRLIVSGWWGIARHINYFGDWLMACVASLLSFPLAHSNPRELLFHSRVKDWLMARVHSPHSIPHAVSVLGCVFQDVANCTSTPAAACSSCLSFVFRQAIALLGIAVAAGDLLYLHFQQSCGKSEVHVCIVGSLSSHKLTRCMCCLKCLDNPLQAAEHRAR